MVAKKDFGCKHPKMDVPNLIVVQLMRSFTSKGFVKEQYAWRHYYWCDVVSFSFVFFFIKYILLSFRYLTNEGIEYLRQYLNLPAEIVPSTLKKSTRSAAPSGRPVEGDRPPRMGRGAGGRDEYRKAQPAPGEYNPTFVCFALV